MLAGRSAEHAVSGRTPVLALDLVEGTGAFDARACKDQVDCRIGSRLQGQFVVAGLQVEQAGPFERQFLLQQSRRLSRPRLKVDREVYAYTVRIARETRDRVGVAQGAGLLFQ